MQKIKTILALGALLGSAAAYAGNCDTGTVEGTYAITGNGWSTKTVDSITTRTPFSGVGVRQNDRNGTFSVSQQFIQDGISGGQTAYSGTYTVSPLPNTKGTCIVSDFGIHPHTGVTSDNGNHISAITISPGNTISFEYVRVSR